MMKELRRRCEPRQMIGERGTGHVELWSRAGCLAVLNLQAGLLLLALSPLLMFSSGAEIRWKTASRDTTRVHSFEALPTTQA